MAEGDMTEEAPQEGRGPNGRFLPGNKGGPGRVKGSRNKATEAVADLLDGEAEALTRKCVEKALEGDMQAMRLCMERIYPALRDKPVRFTLPPMETTADALKAGTAIIQAVS